MLRNGWKSLFFTSSSPSPQSKKPLRSIPSPELVQSSSESCSVLDGNCNTVSERTNESFSQNQHFDNDCDLSGKHHAADCFSADLEMSESAVNEQHLHADSKFIENFSSSNHSDDKFRALSVGQTFNSFEDLYNLAEDYASTNYFKLAKSVTYDTDTNDAGQDVNFSSKTAARGVLRCKGYKQSNCCFKIQFTSVKSTTSVAQYKIKTIDLNHSGHDELKPTLVVEDKYMVYSEADLNEDEYQYISSVGPHMDLAKLRRMMSMTFGKEREYDSNLLNRVIIKAKKIRYGEGLSCGINSFLAEGVSIKEKGGVFSTEVDEFGRLSVVHMQSASMRKYAEQYNDFQIIDGSHNTSMYSTLWIPFTLIDCLGKSVIAGYLFAPSEAAEPIVKGGIFFLLDHEDCVTMTDGSPSLKSAVETMKQKHLLCCHHFMTELPSSASGMDQQTRTKYMTDISQAIYKVQNSESDLDTSLLYAKTVYSPYPAAVKFINKIIEDKSKVCATYTRKFFTCGHVADQRGESQNSRFKEGGKNKKDFAKFNLSEIFEHIENVIKRQQLNAALEIKKLVQQKKLWSEYYDNQFQGEVKLASNYKAELMQELNEICSRKYFVQSKASQDQPSAGHNVTVCTLPQCNERY